MMKRKRSGVDNFKKRKTIIRLYKTGLRKYTMQTLATQFKVSKTTVFNIIHGL